MVFNGAGAAGLACADHYLRLGVSRENVTLCDTGGVVYKGRTKGMNPYKEKFASDTDCAHPDRGPRGADVFVGLSAADCVTAEMLQSMAKKPIVFAWPIRIRRSATK